MRGSVDNHLGLWEHKGNEIIEQAASSDKQRRGNVTIRIVPLTPERWPAFEDLFGKQGACYGCWCTHFRLPPAVRRQNDRQRNKDHIRERVDAGPPPGLLLFDGERADGWMQVGPRADVPEWNNRGRVSAPLEDGSVEDPGVWAISCFFIRSSARGRGHTHRLVHGGIDFARANGARLLEACPMTESKDSRSIGLFVGSQRVFEKAGFATLVERKAGRPLMRLEL
jgi:predicted GNAT family acetyltransferase